MATSAISTARRKTTQRVDDLTNKRIHELTDRPRLIFLVPSLAGGGAERVASTLILYLARHFDLTLALLQDRRSYPVPTEIPVVAFSGPLNSHTAHVIRIPYHILALTRLIRRHRAKVILSFMEQANIINILATCIAGHKAIISQRTNPRQRYEGKGVLGKVISQTSARLYPKADRIIAVSNRIKEIIVSDYKLDARRIAVIPNPVDMASVAELSKKESSVVLPGNYLLHVGRLSVKTKAHDTLLNAFKKLHSFHPDLKLVLVGEGPDREQIKAVVKDLDLSESVILAGWQKNVYAFMARAKAFVLCSRYEGWPNTLVEAMACGCPVVATDCPTGPREILGNNEYGLLVPVDDPEALAHSVEGLLSNESRRTHFQAQARKRAQEFDLEQIGPKYVRLLQGIAKIAA
jgi:N-acetylgalactosamine-N,N'-diacetylbacillosaminyl-diphospho-undecaprenol 4-alpha-N-acetylgalactosaminyltransferase